MPPTSTSQSQAHRWELIDALRGVAAIVVLLFHSLNNFKGDDALPAALGLLRWFTEYGYLGVNVFFALSGWCIAQRVHNAFRRDESTWAFLLERGLRIFPTYWIALAVTLALQTASAAVRGLPPSLALPPTAQAWLGDIALLQPYLHTPVALMVSWSLVYELGFYVIATGVLALRRKMEFHTSLALTVGALLCLWLVSPWQPQVGYVLGRWPDFFAGVIAWSAVRAGSVGARRNGLIALCALGVFQWIATASWIGIAAIGTGLILLFVQTLERITISAVPVLARVGVLSYSLYLIHVSVMSPVQNLAQRWIPSGSTAFILVWLGSLAAAGIAAWLLYHWGEKPIEAWRKSLDLSRKPRARFA
ncbi:MAG: acyltransferase [Opitutaceae bacterium]|nr:acyltransferase [Opitutaceae bacterium]